MGRRRKDVSTGRGVHAIHRERARHCEQQGLVRNVPRLAPPAAICRFPFAFAWSVRPERPPRMEVNAPDSLVAGQLQDKADGPRVSFTCRQPGTRCQSRRGLWGGFTGTGSLRRAEGRPPRPWPLQNQPPTHPQPWHPCPLQPAPPRQSRNVCRQQPAPGPAAQPTALPQTPAPSKTLIRPVGLRRAITQLSFCASNLRM